MIFVDTNVWIYAVGGEHPLRSEAREFFVDAKQEQRNLCASAEVLQELLHIYLSTRRVASLDAALTLIDGVGAEIVALERDDALLARELARDHGHLGARDLIHLAICRRRDIAEIKTFDRALHLAFAEL